jgi:hypothetical protein
VIPLVARKVPELKEVEELGGLKELVVMDSMITPEDVNKEDPGKVFMPVILELFDIFTGLLAVTTLPEFEDDIESEMLVSSEENKVVPAVVVIT